MTYMTLPRPNRSARWSSTSPLACSGAMNSGVPAMMPLCVMLASSAARARPKSVIFAWWFPLSSSTLAGLTSRWISPVAWAAASPSATCRPIWTTSSVSSGPVRSSRCWRVSPGMNSITRYGSGCSSTAYTCTTFSWRTLALERASRRKRLRAGDVAAICGDSTFTATTRWSTSSNARKTIPNPPRADDLEHFVVPEPAQRVGAGGRLQEVQVAGPLVRLPPAGHASSDHGGLRGHRMVVDRGRRAGFELLAERLVQERARLEVGGQQLLHTPAQFDVP